MIFEYIYLMLHRSHFDWLLSQFNRDRHVQAEASLKVRFLIYERAVKDCVASTIGFLGWCDEGWPQRSCLVPTNFGMLISSLDPGFFLHGLHGRIWEGLRIWDLQAENPHESTWMLPSVPLARVKPSKRSGSACRAFKTQRAADCAVAVWMTIKSVSINVLLKKPGWFQLLILQYIYRLKHLQYSVNLFFLILHTPFCRSKILPFWTQNMRQLPQLVSQIWLSLDGHWWTLYEEGHPVKRGVRSISRQSLHILTKFTIVYHVFWLLNFCMQ